MAEKKQHYQSYAAATQHAAKAQQILMVYDGVIRYVQQTKDAIADKRIEDRYKYLSKASEIIMGLQAAIDFENGGTIARLLYEFYSSMDRRIATIHRSSSAKMCDEVMAELTKMRNAWYAMDNGAPTAKETSANTIAIKAVSASNIPDNSSYPPNVTLSA